MPAYKLTEKEIVRLGVMEGEGIRPNASQQELMKNGEMEHIPDVQFTGSGDGLTVPQEETNRSITKRQWISVAILCFVNLINYMDRFTLAGILTKIQCHFHIGDSEAGLLQTAFIVSYMVFAPVFGYLGDRYSRKAIMAFGVFLWSVTTLCGSFMEDFGWFITLRAFVGIGEASYSTIAPTIISDLFVQDVRSKMLAIFYFAIPVGSGLGYIIGSQAAEIGGSWEWGLRVTPALGGIAVLLIIFLLLDPPRGQSEGGSHLSPTSYVSDIKDLCKNRSFIMSTFGFTCVAFVAGALAWWGPKFISQGLALQTKEDRTDEVAYVFGVIAMVAGLIGVPLGSFAATKLRTWYPRADPLVCAFGLFVSTPLMFFGAIVARFSTNGAYALIFFAQVALNMNWSIVADILLYVVIPTRRSTAEAFQILLSHTLGDAGSPYLIGVVSEALKKVLKSDLVSESTIGPELNSTLFLPTTINPENDCSSSSVFLGDVPPDVEFRSLQYSLFITSFVEVLGGVFFILTALYIIRDKNHARKLTAENLAAAEKSKSDPTPAAISTKL